MNIDEFDRSVKLGLLFALCTLLYDNVNTYIMLSHKFDITSIIYMGSDHSIV